jgi:hypothetical protein
MYSYSRTTRSGRSKTHPQGDLNGGFGSESACRFTGRVSTDSRKNPARLALDPQKPCTTVCSSYLGIDGLNQGLDVAVAKRECLQRPGILGMIGHVVRTDRA